MGFVNAHFVAYTTDFDTTAINGAYALATVGIAGLVGGLGFAAAGNIGKDVAVFEPTHGSAPKYDGQDKVNPIACILASKMMLSFLGEGQKADVVGKAIAKVIAEGKARTYDMGGSTKCSEMGAAIAAAL